MNALLHSSHLSKRVCVNSMFGKSLMISIPFTILSSCSYAPSHTVFCDEKKKKDQNSINDSNSKDPFEMIKEAFTSKVDLDHIATTIGTHVQQSVDSGVPTHISYGFICGYSSGYALKKVGKVAGILFGLGFITLQSLQYTGYIEIDHNQLKKDVEKALDLDKHGTLNGSDAKVGFDKILEVLQYNVPGTGGFVAGFLGGLRSG